MPFEAGTIRVPRARTRERCRDDLSAGGDDAPVQVLDGDSVARFYDAVRRLGVKSCIPLHDGIDVTARLYVGSVIDKLLDRNARRQFGETTDVIAMVVGGDHAIDPRETRSLHGCHDPIRITCGGCTAVPRVDEDRLPGRSHIKLGIAAFDIDDVDVQGLRRPALSERGGSKEGTDRDDDEG